MSGRQISFGGRPVSALTPLGRAAMAYQIATALGQINAHVAGCIGNLGLQGVPFHQDTPHSPRQVTGDEWRDVKSIASHLGGMVKDGSIAGNAQIDDAVDEYIQRRLPDLIDKLASFAVDAANYAEFATKGSHVGYQGQYGRLIHGGDQPNWPTVRPHTKRGDIDKAKAAKAEHEMILIEVFHADKSNSDWIKGVFTVCEDTKPVAEIEFEKTACLLESREEYDALIKHFKSCTTSDLAQGIYTARSILGFRVDISEEIQADRPALGGLIRSHDVRRKDWETAKHFSATAEAKRAEARMDDDVSIKVFRTYVMDKPKVCEPEYALWIDGKHIATERIGDCFSVDCVGRVEKMLKSLTERGFVSIALGKRPLMEGCNVTYSLRGHTHNPHIDGKQELVLARSCRREFWKEIQEIVRSES